MRHPRWLIVADFFCRFADGTAFDSSCSVKCGRVCKHFFAQAKRWAAQNALNRAAAAAAEADFEDKLDTSAQHGGAAASPTESQSSTPSSSPTAAALRRNGTAGSRGSGIGSPGSDLSRSVSEPLKLHISAKAALPVGNRTGDDIKRFFSNLFKPPPTESQAKSSAKRTKEPKPKPIGWPFAPKQPAAEGQNSKSPKPQTAGAETANPGFAGGAADDPVSPANATASVGDEKRLARRRSISH